MSVVETTYSNILDKEALAAEAVQVQNLPRPYPPRTFWQNITIINETQCLMSCDRFKLASGRFCGGDIPQNIPPFDRTNIFTTTSSQGGSTTIEGGCSWSLDYDPGNSPAFSFVIGWSVFNGVWKAGVVKSSDPADGPSCASSSSSTLQSETVWWGWVPGPRGLRPPIIEFAFGFEVKLDMTIAFMPKCYVRQCLRSTSTTASSDN